MAVMLKLAAHAVHVFPQGPSSSQIAVSNHGPFDIFIDGDAFRSVANPPLVIDKPEDAWRAVAADMIRIGRDQEALKLITENTSKDPPTSFDKDPSALVNTVWQPINDLVTDGVSRTITRRPYIVTYASSNFVDMRAVGDNTIIVTVRRPKFFASFEQLPDNDGITRCSKCRWPLAASANEGCVPGNCSYRP